MSLGKNYKSGFTLLEILLVVGIIAILAGIVIMAINPTKQLSSVRNVQRKANLAELNKALYQYYIDHSHYPSTLTSTLTEICATGATTTPPAGGCGSLIDLSPLVPTYLVAIPTDPQGSTLSLIPIAYATTNGTGYKVALNAANKVTLSAPQSELNLPVTIGDTTGVLPDHLVSYWSFDDAGSGTALDTMGINNGTVNGPTAATGIRGQVNTAYSFNGNGNYIFSDYGPNINLNPFTIMAWVRSSGNGTTSSRNRILADYATVYLNWEPDNRINFMRTNSSMSYVAVSSNTTFPLNTWHHVVGVYDGTDLFLYVNGELRGSQYLGPSGRNFDELYTGRDMSDWTGYFYGSIDNVRLYNRALAAWEVVNIYNIEKP